MAPRRLSGGWHRRRPTARPLTVGVDVVQQPCDFRWTAPPPSSLAASGGQRCRCSAAPQFPTDGVLPLSSPAIPRDGASPPSSPSPLPADVVDTTRRPFDPQRTPASLSLAAPVVPASVLPAPCVSLLPRRTAPCQLRVKRRAMYSAVPGHGN